MRKDSKHSEETKRKISLSHIGLISGMKGKHHSIKTREKISKIKKGRKLSERNIAGLKNAWKKPEVKSKHSGKNHPQWKGGRYISGGYIYIHQPNHPFYNYVAEHRLVMEKILGRYLAKNEIVHHKNGIRSDNRPENLILTVFNKNWHPCLCPKCGFEFLIK